MKRWQIHYKKPAWARHSLHSHVQVSQSAESSAVSAAHLHPFKDPSLSTSWILPTFQVTPGRIGGKRSPNESAWPTVFVTDERQKSHTFCYHSKKKIHPYVETLDSQNSLQAATHPCRRNWPQGSCKDVAGKTLPVELFGVVDLETEDLTLPLTKCVSLGKAL